VFKPFTSIDIDNLGRSYHDFDNEVIHYFQAQSFNYGDDAALHMKKDPGNLDVLVNQLNTTINEFNTSALHTNVFVNQLIMEMIEAIGLDTNNEDHVADINDISNYTRTFLKRDIYSSENVHNTANNYTVTQHDLSEFARNVITELIHNENLVGRIASVKSEEVGLSILLDIIRNNSGPISKAIHDHVYSTRVLHH
jgi:hypothetical protein